MPCHAHKILCASERPVGHSASHHNGRQSSGYAPFAAGPGVGPSLLAELGPLGAPWHRHHSTDAAAGAWSRPPSSPDEPVSRHRAQDQDIPFTVLTGAPDSPTSQHGRARELRAQVGRARAERLWQPTGGQSAARPRTHVRPSMSLCVQSDEVISSDFGSQGARRPAGPPHSSDHVCVPSRAGKVRTSHLMVDPAPLASQPARRNLAWRQDLTRFPRFWRGTREPGEGTSMDECVYCCAEAYLPHVYCGVTRYRQPARDPGRHPGARWRFFGSHDGSLCGFSGIRSSA